MIIQHLFVALVAFGLADRLIGNEWSVTAMPWVKEQFWGELPMQAPHLWFLLGLVIWGVILVWQYLHITSKTEENEIGWATTKIVLKQAINLDALDDYIADSSARHVIRQRVEYSQESAIIQSTWVEHKPLLSADPWQGWRPEVTLEYDDDNGFVFNAYIKYNTRVGQATARELKDILIDVLVEENVIAPPDEEEEGPVFIEE